MDRLASPPLFGGPPPPILEPMISPPGSASKTAPPGADSSSSSLSFYGEEAGDPRRSGVRPLLWNPQEFQALVSSAGLERARRVVDFGCGWGAFSRLVLESLPASGRVEGFDLDRGAIEEGRNRARQAGLARRLRFEEGDGTRLAEVADASAEAAVCQLWLTHLPDPSLGVAEMIRVVRPSGTVLLAEPDRLGASMGTWDSVGEEEAATDRAQRLVAWSFIAGGSPGWRMGLHLPRLLREGGLERVEIRQAPAVLCLSPPYDSRNERYRAWLEKELQAVLRGDDAEILEGWHRLGGGRSADFDVFWRREKEGAERRLAALARRTLHRVEPSGLWLAWGRKPSPPAGVIPAR